MILEEYFSNSLRKSNLLKNFLQNMHILVYLGVNSLLIGFSMYLVIK